MYFSVQNKAPKFKLFEFGHMWIKWLASKKCKCSKKITPTMPCSLTNNPHCIVLDLTWGFTNFAIYRNPSNRKHYVIFQSLNESIMSCFLLIVLKPIQLPIAFEWRGANLFALFSQDSFFEWKQKGQPLLPNIGPTWWRNKTCSWCVTSGELAKCTYFSFSLISRAVVKKLSHQALQSSQRSLLGCLENDHKGKGKHHSLIQSFDHLRVNKTNAYICQLQVWTR